MRRSSNYLGGARKSGYDENGNLKFASLIVILGIVNITIFTAVMVLTYWVIKSIPGELVIAFFSFWGTEMAVLALKRIFSNKRKEDEEE